MASLKFLLYKREDEVQNPQGCYKNFRRYSQAAWGLSPVWSNLFLPPILSVVIEYKTPMKWLQFLCSHRKVETTRHNSDHEVSNSYGKGFQQRPWGTSPRSPHSSPLVLSLPLLRIWSQWLEKGPPSHDHGGKGEPWKSYPVTAATTVPFVIYTGLHSARKPALVSGSLQFEMCLCSSN